MQEILDAIKRVGAKRLVIDSPVGFEMALAPGLRRPLPRWEKALGQDAIEPSALTDLPMNLCRLVRVHPHRLPIANWQ